MYCFVPLSLEELDFLRHVFIFVLYLKKDNGNFKICVKKHYIFIYRVFEELPSLKQTIKALKLYNDRLGRPHSRCKIGLSVIISGQ